MNTFSDDVESINQMIWRGPNPTEAELLAETENGATRCMDLNGMSFLIRFSSGAWSSMGDLKDDAGIVAWLREFSYKFPSGRDRKLSEEEIQEEFIAIKNTNDGLAAYLAEINEKIKNQNT